MHRHLVWLPVVLAITAAIVGARQRARSTNGDAPSAPAVGATSITVTGGTNFSVAATRDGRTLVIDLLGSLWALRGEGGTATKITEELIEARHPSFSPDGTAVAFQGFKDNGGWDLWSIGPDGSGAKPLTAGPFDDMEPDWSHDGTRIAFSSDRSRNFDIWVLDVRGGGVRQVTSDEAIDSFPAWSPDDKEIVFVRQQAAAPGTPGPTATTLVAISVETGAERPLARVDGRVGPPAWAPDGRQLIYNVIAEGTSRLEMAGLPVAAGEDVFPARVQWVSARAFLYTADGRIKRRTLGSDEVQTVEFRATIPVNPARYTRKRFDFDSPQPRQALGIVRPVVSPDGRRVAFGAIGDLWIMDIGSRPNRVTADQYIDTDPAWSPDGSQLVFSTDRAEMGNLDLWLQDVKTGAGRRLTTTPHADFGASWSPDGTRIAFLGMLPHQQGAAVCVVDVRTGQVTQLWRSQQRISSYPTWSPDGRTLLVAAFDQYSARFREGIWKPLLIPVGGGQPRWVDVTPHVSLVNGVDEGPVWSPDGTRLALAHEGLLKLMAVENGQPTGTLRPLTTEPVQAPSWTADSKHILYLATDRLKMISVDDGKVTAVPLELTYTSAIPRGQYILHAGRVWNGRDSTPRTNVDIVVENNRVKSVGAHRGDLHAGAKLIDASDQTVIPGLIDMHGHVYREYGEATGRLLLAYGVTTVRDPVGMGYRCLELKEASESGARMGPRFYFAYPALDGARGAFAEMYSIDSMERLERELQRAKRLNFDLFKMYVKLPLAMQKRITQFAHAEAGIPVTSHFIYPSATWGADGTEHVGGRASALGNVYDDQMQLLLRSGIQWCPTLAVGGGYDLVAADDPTYLNDERLKALYPEWALEPSRERVERLRHGGAGARGPSLARLARLGKAFVAVTRAGARILAGTDAPNMPNGAGLHAELELLVRAGLTPFEALQTATVNAAEALAAGGDLGSIEPGKLADLVILDADPLVDIRNARRVSAVIKNGRVFDLKTLMTGPGGGGTASGR